MSNLTDRILAARMEFMEQQVIEGLRRKGLLPEGPIPLADCDNCKHMRCNKDGGHCYMFEAKPEGDYCGQFTKDGL